MPHDIIRLQNGLRLVHKEIDSPIAHFGLLINAGTRDEREHQAGLAHFVEHTIFKGTQKRSAYRVISRMEDVGGDLNASTSKEETCFHSSFLAPDYARAVELLSDIFFNATFPEKEIEKEKSVVYEEINYYKDAPAECIFDDFEELIFDGHPLGKNILGKKSDVKKISRSGIVDFISQNYSLDNVVLASVGDITTKKLVKICDRYFGSSEVRQQSRDRQPFTTYSPRRKEVKKSMAQTNVVTGNLAYAMKDDKRVPFLLLNNILGGQGMNTRLNMSIREKKGLAYTVESYYTPLSDTGLFSIYFGCDAHNRDHCFSLIDKELQKIREQKMGTMQLFYAKKQLIGQLALANETKLNEMLALGHTALFYDEVDTFEESLVEIEQITSEQILEVANEILLPERFSTLIFNPRS